MRFSTKFLYAVSGLFFAFAAFAFGHYQGRHSNPGDSQNPFGLTNDQRDLALGIAFLILYAVINWIIRRREKAEAKAN